MENNIITLIGLLCILILLSGFFSASETSFSAINKIRLKNLVKNGSKRAQVTLDLADKYDTLLSTILIGNNIVNIATASIATVIFTHYYGSAGVAISTVFITVVILIVGEISPKSLAKESPEKFAMFATPVLRFLMWILTPFNKFFNLWKTMLTKVFNVTEDRTITEEELVTIINEAQSEGGINEEEGDLIRSAVEFNELEVMDVLTPRVNLTAIDITDSKEKIQQMFVETGFSRMPVYEDNIDNVIGILHEKNFHRFLYSKNTNKNLRNEIQPVIWAFETIKISSLLKMLQSHKSHMAVITDEYGGTMGIVTLEDIIEELVGEIWDEHDEVSQEITKLSNNEYLVDGSSNIDKILSLFNLNIEHDTNTVSGFVTAELGKFPDINDTFIYHNLEVTVLKTDSKRVQQVKFKKLNSEIEASSYSK